MKKEKFDYDFTKDSVSKNHRVSTLSMFMIMLGFTFFSARESSIISQPLMIMPRSRQWVYLIKPQWCPYISQWEWLRGLCLSSATTMPPGI